MLTVEKLRSKAQQLVRAQKTETLIESFDATNEMLEAARGNSDEYLAIAESRGWIMDELESRDNSAFDAWIDSNDDSPRKYFLKG